MMEHARRCRALVLAAPLAALAGCLSEQPPPQRPPPGQWAPQVQWAPPPQGGGGWAPPPQGAWAPPQGGQWVPPGQAAPAMAPPVPPSPGQWVPPPQQTQGPLAWWPQGGTVPVPGWGPLQVPSVPALPGMPAGAAQQCVDGINQYRGRHGLRPLDRWIAAEPCAAAEAQSDAASGQPHGSFGRCGEGAQNVCPGWAGPPEQMTGPCLQSMYNEGPGPDYATHGHFLNMTSPRYARVACGYFTTPQGQVWAVQDFQ